MRDFYSELGLQLDASAEAIQQAVTAHPEKKAAADVLLHPLRKIEYDKAYHALWEIGITRAALQLNSPHWEQEQLAFMVDEQAGARFRTPQVLRRWNVMFWVSAGLLLTACTVMLFFRLCAAPVRIAVPAHHSKAQPAPVVEQWKKNALSNIASFQGKYYKVFDSSEISTVDSWASASRFCQQQHGYMAVIESAEENAFIYDWLQRQNAKDVYFGLTDKNTEGVWCSPKKGRATYLNWAPGEPNNEFGNEDYVLFYHRSPPGFWNDGTPGKNFLFICQWENARNFRAYEASTGGKVTAIHKAPPRAVASPVAPSGKAADVPKATAPPATPPDKIVGDLPPNLAGEYSGLYRAHGRLVGANLVIERKGQYSVVRFTFYPLNTATANKTNSGEYFMGIRRDATTGELVLTGEKWIHRPHDYQFVHLRGWLINDQLQGTVFTDNRDVLGQFSFKKK